MPTFFFFFFLTDNGFICAGYERWEKQKSAILALYSKKSSTKLDKVNGFQLCTHHNHLQVMSGFLN